MLVHRPICLLLAAMLLTLAGEPARAQNEAFFVSGQNQHLYQRLPEFEDRLYGHAYANQAVSQRITRLEKTLFGGTQLGPLESRFARIEAEMRKRKTAEIRAEQEPILTYLEQKLFQRTFEDKTLAERLEQLETHVFGKSFDSYPLSVRLKKLSYAMPIVAKEIRLSGNDGMVIASTNRMSPRTGRTKSPEPEITLLDASAGGRTMPNGEPLSTGDYFQSIHKHDTTRTLRWTRLPVRIHSRAGTPPEMAVTLDAIRAWKSTFEVQTVPDGGQADIIIDWSQRPSAPITRPILHMTDQNAIRTAVFINMAAFKNYNREEQLHAMLHQLGHALGIWGHSDHPNDVMYPHLPQESNDIPEKWGQRSAYVLGRMRPGGQMMPSAEPSQRDINTLLRIYDEPAHDLSQLNAY